jgi:3-oxoacyl-[acyl-carrier-protein] synthase-3
MFINSYIESTGSYLPSGKVTNAYFLDRTFKDKKGMKLSKPTEAVVEKLEEITQIKERRYEEEHDTSYMASEAGCQAINHSRFEKEAIDGIIVAHNFGNVEKGDHQGHMIPNLAAMVKNRLGIKNPKCFAFDVLYGCPGWLLAMNQAHQYIQMGAAKSVLVIGVESLSRVVYEEDVDAMLFGDGAGAVILAREESEKKRGILGYDNYSDCMEEAEYLKMSRPPGAGSNDLFIDMTGRSVFKYAVSKMPQLITEYLRELSIPIHDIHQFIFHQANGKMLEAIGQGVCQLNGIESIMDKVPITLDRFGNTSVATIPTLLDFMKNGQMNGFRFEAGQKMVMASVGAGMHVNCMVYQY